MNASSGKWNKQKLCNLLGIILKRDHESRDRDTLSLQLTDRRIRLSSSSRQLQRTPSNCHRRQICCIAPRRKKQQRRAEEQEPKASPTNGIDRSPHGILLRPACCLAHLLRLWRAYWS